jgi:hypothetical protein
VCLDPNQRKKNKKNNKKGGKKKGKGSGEPCCTPYMDARDNVNLVMGLLNLAVWVGVMGGLLLSVPSYRPAVENVNPQVVVDAVMANPLAELTQLGPALWPFFTAVFSVLAACTQAGPLIRITTFSSVVGLLAMAYEFILAAAYANLFTLSPIIMVTVEASDPATYPVIWVIASFLGIVANAFLIYTSVQVPKNNGYQAAV